MSPSRGQLDALPSDLARLIIADLDVTSLSRLSLCNKSLLALADLHGWPRLERELHHGSATLHRVTSSWSPKQHVRFGLALNKAWDEVDAALLQLGPTWRRKALPVLDLDRTNGRVLLGNGPDLHLTPFDERGASEAGTMEPIRVGESATDDLTGVATITDSHDFITSTLSGSLQRHHIIPGCSFETLATYNAGAECVKRHAIEALAANTSLIATANTSRSSGPREGVTLSDGQATGWLALHALHSPAQPPSLLALSTRPWSISLLSSDTLALGHSGETPLSVHSLLPTGFDHLAPPRDLTGPDFRSAVYAFAPFPSSTPRDDIVLTGWYDGVVRIHDLRHPGTTPVLSLSDPFSADAIYSLSSTPSSHTIVAGTARHSAIKLADLRQPRLGLHTTVFASRANSPVYSLALDGRARLYGATENRAFMFDFKPGVVGGGETAWREPPSWVAGTRPRYTRTNDGLRLRVYGDEDVAPDVPRRTDQPRWETGKLIDESEGHNSKRGRRRRRR